MGASWLVAADDLTTRRRPGANCLAPPLAAQTLVNILKQPFFVGEARRLVLEQLTRHYHRPFTEQLFILPFGLLKNEH